MTDLPALREAVARLQSVQFTPEIDPGARGWIEDGKLVAAALPALLDELEALRASTRELGADLNDAEYLGGSAQQVALKLAKQLDAERIEVARLREAFVTMERAANQHETERDRALADLDDAATAINEAMDILGLAGIDQPITVVDAARSRMDDLAAAKAVLDGAVVVPMTTKVELIVENETWLAWQGRAK